MKLKNARTCEGCPALIQLQYGVRCEFPDFSCDSRKATPDMPCPKPKSIKEYVNIRLEEYRSQKWK